jgi:glycosyltransferase involved in cell wall biosynthesis
MIRFTVELQNRGSQLKILQIVYAFYPPYSESGNSRVAYEISKGLARKGHDVAVCTTNVLAGEKMFDPKKKVYNIDGFKVHYHRSLFYKPHAFVPLFYSQGVVDEIKNISDYDVIHLHENRFYTSILLHHYAKKYGIPYVLQAHGDLPRISKHGPKVLFDVFFGYRLLRDASKVIALTNTEAEQYKSMGVPYERIAVIPNGIDLSEYADLPPKGSFKKKFNIQDKEKIVLYLGRIHRIKGVDILVRAFANVIKKLDDVRLVVVGPDDGYLSELEALIKALKIEDQVLISGPLYGRDKLDAYVDADVYVLPSRYEIFGMTALESVACGTPVILTENCGIAEYFRDKTGLVVNADSPSNLQEALLEMLVNRERQKVFRRNCKTVMQKFNISETVSKLEKVYQDL